MRESSVQHRCDRRQPDKTDSTMPANNVKSSSKTEPRATITEITEAGILNDEDIGLIMRRKLGTKDFRIKTWSLDRHPGTNGFLGQYFNLRVTCSLDGGNDEQFQFFAKTEPPRDSPQCELAITGNVFKREIKFYEEIADQMGSGVGQKWKAECYLGKNNESIIILEDATLDGFAMPDKLRPFGYDECLSMLYAFSKLHSRSLILDEKLRRDSGKRLDEVYSDIMQEGLFPSDDKTRRNFIGPSVQGAWALVDLIECLDDWAKRRIKSLIADWAWRIPRLLRTSNKYRNVICHRDPWANNMMIKRDPKTGKPVGFYLIDFQFIRYSPPAIDFMLSLYLTTRRKTRDEHFEQFAKIYHDLLRDELERENVDIDKCDLGWDVFRESCEYYRCLAIIYVTVNQQIMLIDQESVNKYFVESPELVERVIWGCGRPELVCPIFATQRDYRERFTENIMEINDKISLFDVFDES